MLWEVLLKECTNIFKPTFIIWSEIVVPGDVLQFLYIRELLHDFVGEFLVFFVVYLKFVDFIIQYRLLDRALLLGN